MSEVCSVKISRLQYDSKEFYDNISFNGDSLLQFVRYESNDLVDYFLNADSYAWTEEIFLKILNVFCHFTTFRLLLKANQNHVKMREFLEQWDGPKPYLGMQPAKPNVTIGPFEVTKSLSYIYNNSIIPNCAYTHRLFKAIAIYEKNLETTLKYEIMAANVVDLPNPIIIVDIFGKQHEYQIRECCKSGAVSNTGDCICAQTAWIKSLTYKLQKPCSIIGQNIYLNK
eukprot:NODE_472_length_7027_cov_1.012413.p5 type:complete len:227 gc:universal NODE_472_length_7027_cov_1.012413:3144-2464(-)